MLSRRLLVLPILLLVVAGTVATLGYSGQTVNATSYKALIVVLPPDVPSDPSVGDRVADALSYINGLLYNETVKGYMYIRDASIGGTAVPKGSIILYGGEQDIEDAKNHIDQLGITTILLDEIPDTIALKLVPPKIGFLDVGDTYTIHDVLKQMNFRYTIVAASDVGNLIAEGYDVFILPPGSGTSIARTLGSSGAEALAQYLMNGGGLIGVCAGAYAVIKGYNEPTSQLQLVDATLKNWPNWWLGTGIVKVEVTNPYNPVVYGFEDGFEAIYWNGPVLEPYDLGTNTTGGIDVPPYTELIKYVSTDHTPGAFSYGWGDFNQSYVDSVMANGSAVTLSYYGKGRIVLFSIHPELTSGDTSYAPNSTLPSRYNWRLLFNAIYYVSRSAEITATRFLRGTWVWPSTYRSIYTYIKDHYPGISDQEALDMAAEFFAEELASYGITDVFIEVKSIRGYAFYPSNVLPAYPLAPYNETNIYKPLIEKLHSLGIRVHAWIICFRDQEVWGPKDPVYHVGKSVSDWQPYPVTKYVRPANTTYVNVLADLAKELLRMGFDGIHLDYIRYGHMVYSFSPKDIERAEARGINVSKVIDAIRKTFYSDYPGGYDPTYIWRLYLNGDPDIVAWFNMRREDIRNAIQAIAEAAREQGTVTGQEPILSAALMPDVTINRTVDSFTIPGPEFQMLHYGQIYSDFASTGYWLIPMAYFRSYGMNTSWVGVAGSYAASVAANYSTIALVGIQAWSASYEEVEEEINYALSSGARGYVLFRWYTYRSIVRDEYGEQYLDQYTTYYNAIPYIMNLMAKYNAGDTGLYDKLLKDYIKLDLIINGYLYPEPTTTISAFSSDIDKALDTLYPVIADKISTLKSAAPSDLKDKLNYIEVLLSRASTASSIDEKLGILDTIASTIDSIEQTLETDNVKDTLHNLSTTLENEIANIGDIISSIDELERALSDIVQTVSSLNATEKDLDNRVSSLENKVSSLESDLGDSKSKLTSRVDDLSKRLDDVESSVSSTLYTSIAISTVIAVIVAVAVGFLLSRSKK